LVLIPKAQIVSPKPKLAVPSVKKPAYTDFPVFPMYLKTFLFVTEKRTVYPWPSKRYVALTVILTNVRAP